MENIGSSSPAFLERLLSLCRHQKELDRYFRQIIKDQGKGGERNVNSKTSLEHLAKLTHCDHDLQIQSKLTWIRAERDILFPDYFRTETEDLWGNYLKAIEVEVEARTAMLSKCQTLGAASKLAIQEHQKAKKSREEYYQRIRYVVQRTRFELATNPHRYHKSFWSLVVAKVGELDAASECLRKDTVTVQSVAENMAGSTPYVGVSSPSDPWAPVAVRKGEFIEEAEMKKKMKEEEIERQRIEFEGSKRQRLGEWVMSVDPEQDNHEQEEN